jgi:aconitate hydratase
MLRGTFANVRIKNLMLPPRTDGTREEGGVTLFQPSGEKMSIYDAAMRYIAQGTATVVFGGEEYGTGSSRDWAAKGTQLLGVRAVIAKSFARIHRRNLVLNGVVTLRFVDAADYERAAQGDPWRITGVHGGAVVADTPSGAIELELDVLPAERDALLAGGLLNLLRERERSHA